jgi:predicted PurR-regulated permease PerM
MVERQAWFWLVALAALLFALHALSGILLPFVVGAAIAYLLDPLAGRLTRGGTSRAVAAAALVGLALLVVGGLLAVAVPWSTGRIVAFASGLPDALEQARPGFEARLGAWLGEPNLRRLLDFIAASAGDFSRLASDAAGSLLPALLGRGLAFVNLLGLLLVTPIVAFYLLLDWRAMLARAEELIPPAHRPRVLGLAGELAGAVAAAVRGQGTVCLVLAAFYAAGLWAVGLQHGVFIGLATGLMLIVPIVGWLLGATIAIVTGLLQWGVAPVPLALVAGVLLAGQALDSALLSPRIVGGKIGLHPVWMIFALFACSYLFGFAGTLVAVPLAAAVGVLVRHLLAAYRESAIYTSGGPASGAGEPAAEQAGEVRP